MEFVGFVNKLEHSQKVFIFLGEKRLRTIIEMVREFNLFIFCNVIILEKFPDCSREQVCSLIGGFYLLRFINPAVVTPQAFMLVSAKLSANTRRNLTLVKKNEEQKFVVKNLLNLKIFLLACENSSKFGKQCSIRRQRSIHGTTQQIFE